MLIFFILEKIIFFLVNIILILLCIAIFTLIERKVMSSVQRRKGPNITGLFGFLKPFADGLKLLLKEIIVPSNSNLKINKFITNNFYYSKHIKKSIKYIFIKRSYSKKTNFEKSSSITTSMFVNEIYFTIENYIYFKELIVFHFIPDISILKYLFNNTFTIFFIFFKLIPHNINSYLKINRYDDLFFFELISNTCNTKINEEDFFFLKLHNNAIYINDILMYDFTFHDKQYIDNLKLLLRSFFGYKLGNLLFNNLWKGKNKTYLLKKNEIFSKDEEFLISEISSLNKSKYMLNYINFIERLINEKSLFCFFFFYDLKKDEFKHYLFCSESFTIFDIINIDWDCDIMSFFFGINLSINQFIAKLSLDNNISHIIYAESNSNDNDDDSSYLFNWNQLCTNELSLKELINNYSLKNNEILFIIIDNNIYINNSLFINLSNICFNVENIKLIFYNLFNEELSTILLNSIKDHLYNNKSFAYILKKKKIKYDFFFYINDNKPTNLNFT